MSLSMSWGILKVHILDGELISDEGRRGFPPSCFNLEY